MKTKYVVGILTAFLIAAGLLAAGYQISYRYVMERQASRAEENTSTESIAAKGQAVNEEQKSEEGYYLCELHGYVAVYLSDRSTIYELTDIALTQLPQEVQQEVAEGKYISTDKELYGFLENYSS